MEIIRDRGVSSGFRFEHPLRNWPVLTHCGEAVCLPRHDVTWHAHQSFEFTFMVRGALSIEVAGQIVALRAGDLFIAYPHERHRWAREAHPEFQQLWVGVDLPRLGRAAAAVSKALGAKKIRVLENSYEAEPVLRGLIRQVMSQRAGFKHVIRAHLLTFVALLQQQLSQQSASDEGQRPYSAEVERALRYMREHLGERLSLTVLGQAAGLSKSHFCRRFRAETGLSPAAQQMRLRLEKAREVLCQPDMSVTAVALSHGFSSSQHFATSFRRAFGVAPGHFRQEALSHGKSRT